MTLNTIIIRIPGLLKDKEFTGVSYGSQYNAVVTNKSIVLTNGDPMAWVDNDTYVVTDCLTMDGSADEVIVNPDWLDAVLPEAALRNAAAIALMAGEPGPIAAKFLTRIMIDDHFPGHLVRKAQVVSESLPNAA